MDSMDIKRSTRKRKHEIEENTEDGDTELSNTKTRPFDEKARLEEEELAKDLFGDNLGFLKSLEEAALIPCASTSADIDSGVGETETECESSSDELKRKPAWHDDEDDGIDVSSALKIQGRNLPAGGICDRKRKYTELLKDKFTAIVGTPNWAKFNRKPTDDDSDEEILQSCGYIAKSKPTTLPSSVLEYKKVRDLNSETYSEGPLINSVEFHPSSTVALVAGVSGVASIFAVDGRSNNKLHSISFTKFPIECARFIHDGNEAILGSNKSHFFSFDLISAKAIKIQLSEGITNGKCFEVNSNNHLIAIAGKFGEVHLLSSRTKEFITTLKQNENVTALAFNPDGSHLFSHSDVGEVTVWNVPNRRVIHKWYDDGCLKGTTLTVSPSGQLVAAGSAQGAVNVYNTEDVLSQNSPKPRKSILNLTTSISSMKFNSTSETLGFASSDMANAVRLLHVSSGTVYKNFPQFGSKLGRINYLSFSPNSGYAAFGNRKATVALYRLKHYNNY